MRNDLPRLPTVCDQCFSDFWADLKKTGTTQCIVCEHPPLEKGKVVICVPVIDGGAPAHWVVMGPLTYFDGAVLLTDLVKGLSLQVTVSDVSKKLH